MLKHISAEWYAIGRELKVDSNYREGLINMGMRNDDKLEKVLNEWFQSECSDVTWGTIERILHSLNRKDVLRKVKEHLSQTTQC